MNSAKQTAPTGRAKRRAGFSVPEIRKLTGLSRSLLYGAIADGRLKATRVGPRRLIVTPTALEEFLQD